jgi:hypothetical protein
MATGETRDWSPGFDAPISILALSKDTLYAGGIFSHVGGQEHYRLAALDRTTGAVKDWSPEIGSQGVEEMMISEGTLYIGGEFDFVETMIRPHLAGFVPSLSNSSPTSLKP